MLRPARAAAILQLFGVVIVAQLTIQPAAARLTITASSPSPGTILPKGTTATLTCTASAPWFLCIWEGPGGVACQCQTKVGGVNSMCQGYPRLSLSGGANECSATITNVSPEDAGLWRCMLADQTDYATVSRTLDLGVGVAGVLGWAGSLRQGGRLAVKEQEEVEVGCQSLASYPASTIVIEGSDSLTRGRDISQPSATSGGSPTVDVTQTARYRGNLQDNGRSLTCTAVQRDMAGVILYTATVDLKLEVTGAVVGAALAIPIGGIFGIVLGILLLFLLCGLCAFFLISGKGKGSRRGRQWIVSGQEGRAGIATDEHFVDHSDYIEASKTEFPPSVPVVHEVLVKGSSSGEDKLNYDANRSLGFIAWSGGKRASSSRNDMVTPGGLETILMAKGDDSSDSGSSHSSSSSSSNTGGKAKKIKRQNVETDLHQASETVKLLEVERESFNSGIAKYDTTIIYNGRHYEEEDFEKHLATSSGQKVRIVGKRLKEKWKNNLLGILEGEQDDRPSEHISSSSRASLGVDATASAENRDYFRKETGLYQNCTSFFDWSGGLAREEADERQLQQDVSMVVHEENETRRMKSSDLVQTTRRIETAEQTTNTRQVAQALSSFASDIGQGRQLNDDHYYIGSSEYAEVVEEHVSGKYEGDLQYYEGKIKEVVEVDARIMTKEELLTQFYESVEQSEVQQMSQPSRRGTKNEAATEGRETRIIITRGQENKFSSADLSPPPPPALPPDTSTTTHQYIADWIQTENLAPPSSPDSGLSQRSLSPAGPVQNTEEELDRSDESVIVTVNHRMIRRNNSDSGQSESSSSSGSAYKHIADYLKSKQRVQQPHSANITRREDQQIQQRSEAQTPHYAATVRLEEELRSSSSNSSVSQAEPVSQAVRTTIRDNPQKRPGHHHHSTMTKHDQLDLLDSDTSSYQSAEEKIGHSKQAKPDQQHIHSTGNRSKLVSNEQQNFVRTQSSSHQRKEEQQFRDTSEIRSHLVKAEQKHGQPYRHELYHVSDSYNIVNKDKHVQDGEKPLSRPEVSLSKAKQVNAEHYDHGKMDIVHKQYRITQQEIIFYLKKADGIIKVVRRPLISSEQPTMNVKTGPKGKKKAERSPMIRHLSQPDLRRSPPAHSDSTITVENRTFNIEEYENVVVDHQTGGWDRLDHLDNVGLLHHHHHGPTHGQVSGLSGEWRSSGSIFDCRMKCFQEPAADNLPPCLV